MRLRELKFSHVVPLGPGHNLALNRRITLVLGDNEAGKSTMRRAIEAFLFGPTQQLVAPGDVGTFDCSAVVETAGASEAELRRRGRNWAVPLPGQLQPLLAPDLASRFRDLFCLSHENLFPEDKRFLTADGTLGSLLFGASSGLAPQALATAQKDINLALSTARGRRAGTDSLGIRLDEYAIQRTNHAQVARFHAHEQATAALARARESLVASDQKMEAIAHARRELDRLLNGATAFAEWQEAVDTYRQWAESGSLPNDSQRAEVTSLLGQLELLREQHDRFAQVEQTKRETFERCETPGPVAQLAATVESLREAVAESIVDRRELDDDRQKLASTRQLLQQRLDALGADADEDAVAAATRLLLPLPARATLEEALKAHKKLTDERANWKRSRDGSEAQLREALRNVKATSLQDLVAVELAIPHAENAARLEKELARQQQMLQRKTAEATIHLQALGLRAAPEGDRPITAPDRLRTAELEVALKDARELSNAMQQQLERVGREHRQKQSECEALRARLGEIPTDARIAEARALRDEKWEALKSRWTPEFRAETRSDLAREALEFQVLMQHVDALHTLRIAAGEMLGQLQAAEATLAADARQLQDSSRENHEACKQLTAIEDRWSEHWQLLEAPPTNAGEWYARRDAWHGAELERTGLQSEIETTSHARDIALADARAHAATELPQFTHLASAVALRDALDDEARRRRTNNEGARALQEAVRVAELTLARTEDQLALLIEDEARWAADWATEISRLPAGVGGTPVAVRTWLDAQEEISRLCREHQESVVRIDDRRARADALDLRLRELLAQARDIDPDLGMADTLAPINAYPALLEKAVIARQRLLARRQAEQEHATAAGHLLDTQEKREASRNRLHAIWNALGYAQNPDDLVIRQCLNNASLSAQARQRAETTDAALRAHWGDQRTHFEQLLRERGEASFRSDLELLKLDAKDAANAQEAARREVHIATQQLAALNATHDALAVAASFVAARDAVIDKAEELHRLELASFLIERAKAEASKSQEHIQQCASSYFATLTKNAYTGLHIDAENNVLLAVEPRGHKKLTQLSAGTRDQIWLALRLAAIVEAARETPFPLILDDIFVHFDDERSSAALRLLIEVSEHVQVIAFTHHDHIADLAQAVIPAEQLALITLPRPDATMRVRTLGSRSQRERPAMPVSDDAGDSPAVEEDDDHEDARLSRRTRRTEAIAQAAEQMIIELLRNAATPQSRSDLIEAARLVGFDLEDYWTAAIRVLVSTEQVVQAGLRRTARYNLPVN
jgi:hypothetical protein